MGRRALEEKRAEKRVIRRLEAEACAALRDQVRYEGSPAHKKEPNNFGLTPPAAPRPDATLCDEARVFDREVAAALWTRALERGLVNEATVGSGLPKHIWVVDEAGQAFEAIHGGSRAGACHGYPIRRSDPFYGVLIAAWEART
jgi:hypothetical protein